MKTQLTRLACALSLLLAACGDGDELPELEDPGMVDAGRWDAGPLDARVAEAGRRDSSTAGND